jgi:RNA polymerase sigma-70 factor (TIGR02943 family)
MNVLNPVNWITNYSDQLYTYTLKRINNTVQAEDIVQDVFLSAWKSRETYNGTAAEKTWLFAICKNKIVDFYRKEKGVVSLYTNYDENDDGLFMADGHFSNTTLPQQNWGIEVNKVEQKEFYTVLSLCKSKLKKIQEQVFSMKYLEDIEADEICKLLSITSQNYWVLIHRAKVQLRTCLEKNWINS